jgi:toxin ParE1/3/4
MRKLRILAAAAEEAAEAAAWYEMQRPGLGAEFERAVDAALDLLEEEIVPLTSVPGAAGKRGARRLILKRFPYDVVVRERGA